MIRKLMAICLVGMFITGSLWLVAEFAPLPEPTRVRMTDAELNQIADTMLENMRVMRERNYVANNNNQ